MSATIQINSRTITLPSWWAGAGFTAKAGWLSGQGVSYPKACAILAQRPRKAKPPTVAAFTEQMEQRKLF